MKIALIITIALIIIYLIGSIEETIIKKEQIKRLSNLDIKYCPCCSKPIGKKKNHIPEDFDFDTWLENQPEGTFVQGGGLDSDFSENNEKKGLTFQNQSFIINMLIVSATRIRPVVANDYRKWLILIFYSFFYLTKLKFPFCLLRLNYNLQEYHKNYLKYHNAILYVYMQDEYHPS